MGPGIGCYGVAASGTALVVIYLVVEWSEPLFNCSRRPFHLLDCLSPEMTVVYAVFASVDRREMLNEVPVLLFFCEVRKRRVPRCFEMIRWESQRPSPVPEILLVT
jgi:hypothetical protein